MKSIKLQELELSVQEKDTKIVSLKNEIKLQAQKISESQDLNQSLNESFELKSSELTEKINLQQSLENEAAALKLQIETEIPQKEKVEFELKLGILREYIFIIFIFYLLSSETFLCLFQYFC